MLQERLAFTMQEAAAACGLSRRSLDYHYRNGTLKTVKIGRRRIVKATELQRFISADRPSLAPAPKRNKNN